MRHHFHRRQLSPVAAAVRPGRNSTYLRRDNERHGIRLQTDKVTGIVTGAGHTPSGIVTGAGHTPLKVLGAFRKPNRFAKSGQL